MTPQEQIDDLKAMGVRVHDAVTYAVSEQSLENLVAQDCRTCQRQPGLGEPWYTWAEPIGGAGYVGLVSLCSQQCVQAAVNSFEQLAPNPAGYAIAYHQSDTPPDNSVTIEADEDEDPFSVMERAARQFFGGTIPGE